MTAAQQTIQERKEELTRRYEPTRKEQTVQAFDKQPAPLSYQRSRDLQERISQAPHTSQDDTIGTLHRDYAKIQLDLIDINDEYEKLNISLTNLLGSSRIFTPFDAAKIGFFKFLGRKAKVREVKEEALGRRGDSLEILVNNMGEVVSNGYQTSLDAVGKCNELLSSNVQRQMHLNYSLSDTLKSGHFNTSELVQAEAEVTKLQSEIDAFDALIGDYETEIRAAKQTNNIPQIETLTKDLGDLLDKYQGVLDGKLSADGQVSDIRRKILDSSETVQSIKGAISASRVNYKAINALVDSMNELAIKYRNAQDHMIPVFVEQAKIAGVGMEALSMKETLLRIAGISQQLMDTNSKLVMHLANETFELLKTPMYDPVKAKEIENRIDAYMGQLNKTKMEWAEMTQTLKTPTQEPHYRKQR